MEPQVFVSFVLATATMIALPGPSVLLTVAHSLSFGWRRALITVSGATLGIALQLLVAVIGIGSLIKFVAATFDVLRWAGAGYLIYFGVKVWINARDLAAFGKGVDVRPNRLLMQGLAVTVFNPKSLLFIAAFLPQFVDASRPVETQFLIIVPVFLVITFVVTSGWAVVSGAVNNVIKNPETLAVIFRVASALIVLSGISMVVVRRGA
jgi:threonine/homoserine/homoserine lactone efflux protein